MKIGEASLHITFQRNSVSIRVSEGLPATIHVSHSQSSLQECRLAGSSVDISKAPSMCPCLRCPEPRCCCSSRKVCCGSADSCSRRASSSCQGRRCCPSCCCEASQLKRPCFGSPKVPPSRCISCSQQRPSGDFDSLETIAVGSEADAVVREAEAEEALQALSSSAAELPADGNCLEKQGEQQQKQQPLSVRVKRQATWEAQQLWSMQNALESQQQQFLLRQEEYLRKQKVLEKQHEQLQRKQQELVIKLQHQQEELSQKQAQIFGQQRQLEQQHAEQEQLLEKKAAQAQQLQCLSREPSADEPLLEEEQQPRCSRQANTGKEADRQQSRRKRSESLDSRISNGTKRGSSGATDTYLSPVDEGRSSDDEFTCV